MNLDRLRAELLALENHFAAVLESAGPLLQGDPEVRKDAAEEFIRSLQRMEAAIEADREIDLHGAGEVNT